MVFHSSMRALEGRSGRGDKMGRGVKLARALEYFSCSARSYSCTYYRDEGSQDEADSMIKSAAKMSGRAGDAQGKTRGFFRPC